MKQSISSILAVLLSITVLAACTRDTTEETADDERLRVYTSFYTIYDFTTKIAGEGALVQNLVPAGTDSHHWEPAAQDIKSLEEADVFVYNGAGMEHWVEDVLATLENDDLIVVDTSTYVDLIDGHSHDEEEHDHDHDHDHGDFDPHIWLDPNNAKLQMEAIKDALVTTDPEQADLYTENYQEMAKELDALDLEFKEQLKDLTRRDIVVSHEAFSYLCRAYDLHQIGVEGLVPDSEPDPARLAEIIDTVREDGIMVIFFESLTDTRIADVIADETDARVAILHPIEGLTEEQIAAGSDYFSLMRENLEALVDALK